MFDLKLKNVRQLQAKASCLLESEQEAWWLLEHVTGISRSLLIAQPEQELTDDQVAYYVSLVTRRINDCEPLQYLIGTVPFCDLELIVRSPILIPRPETEEWVWRVIALCKKDRNRIMKVLDLCTGSGCIALALAHHCPWLTVIAVDNNADAITLAEENKMKYHLNNVQIIKSDLYQELGMQRFDLIVTNPPYLSEQEYSEIDVSVRDWEDRSALVAEDNGNACYKRIIDGLKDHLTPIDKKEAANRHIVFFAELGEHVEPIVHYYQKQISPYVFIENDLQEKPRLLVGAV